MNDLPPPVVDYLLAIADDKHLMGQQHAEWIGVTPFLEEDLAFCSIGQDELGHAAHLYALLAGDDDTAIDELAYRHEPGAYRSCWFVERATPIWAEALVRHWMFDAADQLRWSLLAGSSLSALADLAQRVEREERYHRLHSDTLLDGLLASPVAAEPIGAAVTALAPFALTMFEPVAGEPDTVAEGVAEAPFATQRDAWKQRTEARFAAACTIDWPDDPPYGDNRTTRSADFGPLMARMREVIDLDPSAVW